MTSSNKVTACALLILVGIGALSFWSEERNEHDREWVTHTLLVVEKLQTVRIDITQAETGQRGYMLTGKERYLELYSAGVQQVRGDMNELPDLIRDNPSERDAIQTLQPLITARLAELDAGIEVRKRSGLLAGAEAVTRANNGEKWMGQIAAQIGQMRQAEEGLLTRRLETEAASTTKIKAAIVLGNSLAILILLLKGLVIQKEIVRRTQAEENLKRSNVSLERRTTELSESNKELLATNVELESFAYSVAHDLRAPLRHIAGYSNIIAQDYGPLLDAEGLRFLKKIIAGAQNLGHLVDDLLGLSKVGQQVLSLEATPLDALLRELMDDLAPELAARAIEWRIGELPVVECDRVLMRQVFANLLLNAVKYTRKRDLAVIEVGQIMLNGERVIRVRDNGVGFEMQYAGKLFGVFQRLHKAGDFEGTGVGLAVVQRIVRKHGGRIWAEAELDRGATFFFTLGSSAIIPRTDPELANENEEEAMHVARS
jgi:signal transduction histidine kinase